MRIQAACGLFAIGLTACGAGEAFEPAQDTQPVKQSYDIQPPAAQNPPYQTPESQNHASQAPAIKTKTRPEGTQFSDVLQEYKEFNDRIARLHAPLRLANTQLCPKTERDPGFITHKLSDYPPHMQGMAREFLGLSDTGIFIRSVRRGSPADQAQIQVGDKIIAINDKDIADVEGETQARFYAALARNAFNGVRTYITLQSPQGREYETKIRAQTACNIPVSVIFSEDINGHTDGSEIFITSALMSAVGDDVNLSLVLAHEMGHVIAGHAGQTPTETLELEADRMALVLMQNAGLDIGAAIEFWDEAAHPHIGLQDNSETHPSITARYENFRKEQSRIKRQLSKGETLSFGKN